MPQRETVAFAAFAPLPKEFGERDRQKLAVVVRVLSDGTQEYSRRTVFRVTDGGTVQASLLPNGVIVRFSVPKANLSNGVALMEGLLRRPTLVQESLDVALRRLQRREPDYWTAALRPGGNSLKTLRPGEARAVLLRVFSPARTVVSAVGGFAEGEARSRWKALTADWKPLPEPRYPDISVAPEPKESATGVTTVELRGAPFSAADPALPARWLAMVALGVGKGSSLFRDVRQVEGWSYRQEAVLWPDRGGLVPRLVVVTTPEAGEASRAEGLRATLRKSIDGWTEEDRLRALGAVRLNLGPLWILDAPMSDGLLDRATLEAYWMAKAGVGWDADRLRESMRGIALDALKAEAAALVTNARAVVLPGRP